MAAIARKPLRRVRRRSVSCVIGSAPHERFGRRTTHIMRHHLLIGVPMARRAAITAPIFAMALLTVSPSAAQDAPRTATPSCAGDNGGSALAGGLFPAAFLPHN